MRFISRFKAEAGKKPARIYILPTRFGLIFITGALVMILIGSAYQNNLVNMLAFFMLSLVFVCMILTHVNLKYVRVQAIDADGGFSGGEFLVTTVVANDAKVSRANLEAQIRKTKAKQVYENHHTLAPSGTIKLRASYQAAKRGVYQIKGARLSSVYPLGLFEAWAWFHHVSCDYHIYPEPRGERVWPENTMSEGIDVVHQGVLGGDDFHGHRKFNPGDSQHAIDWKAHARGRPLLIKEFTEGAPGAIVFTWNSLPNLDVEARLSQLALWVEIAKQNKMIFALQLPNEKIPPGQGLQHAVRCLRALARYHESLPPSPLARDKRA